MQDYRSGGDCELKAEPAAHSSEIAEAGTEVEHSGGPRAELMRREMSSLLF